MGTNTTKHSHPGLHKNVYSPSKRLLYFLYHSTLQYTKYYNLYSLTTSFRYSFFILYLPFFIYIFLSLSFFLYKNDCRSIDTITTTTPHHCCTTHTWHHHHHHHQQSTKTHNPQSSINIQHQTNKPRPRPMANPDPSTFNIQHSTVNHHHSIANPDPRQTHYHHNQHPSKNQPYSLKKKKNKQTN